MPDCTLMFFRRHARSIVETANPQSHLADNWTNIFLETIIKKKFIGRALSGLCAAHAFAESSTTFFGAIDMAIRHIQYSQRGGSATSGGSSTGEEIGIRHNFFVEIGRPFKTPGRGEDIASNRFIPAAPISNTL